MHCDSRIPSTFLASTFNPVTQGVSYTQLGFISYAEFSANVRVEETNWRVLRKPLLLCLPCGGGGAFSLCGDNISAQREPLGTAAVVPGVVILT
jgi:hypothetical protein